MQPTVFTSLIICVATRTYEENPSLFPPHPTLSLWRGLLDTLKVKSMLSAPSS
jgi:hypothetical protein